MTNIDINLFTTNRDEVI